MADLDHARDLSRLAQRDLVALQAMADVDAFPDEIFGFHAQQAVEKALKAWLVLIGVQYPKTHDLSRLLALLEEAGVSAMSHWDLVDLTVYAVQFRYSIYEEVGDPVDRVAIRGAVLQLVERVEQLVEQAARAHQ